MTRSTSSKIARLFGFGAVALTGLGLASCSAFQEGNPGNPQTESWNLDSAATSSANARSGFSGSLAQNYYALATTRAQQGDKVDADYWSRKSLAAANGTPLQPELLRHDAPTTPVPLVDAAKPEASYATNWDIPGLGDPPNSANVDILADAREELVSALDGGARDRYPALAARAQAYFDCSVERGEANIGDPIAQACWAGFMRDYADLYLLLHPPGQKNAYFDYNSATLTPEGQKAIAGAVADIRDSTAKLKIVGKADLSGTDAYNMSLSQARAEAIHNAAVSDGLTAGRVNTEWVGETQPPVPTPNGVKEARNRVVEIDTVMPAAQVAALPPNE